MAKRGNKRQVSSDKWIDDYMQKMLEERDYYSYILFDLFLTGREAHISGLFKISIYFMCVYTRLTEEEVNKCLKKFEKDNKVVYRKGWIGLKNAVLHQNPNASMKVSIINSFSKEAPVEVVEWVLRGNPDLHSELKSFTPEGYESIKQRINDSWNIQEEERDIDYKVDMGKQDSKPPVLHLT